MVRGGGDLPARQNHNQLFERERSNQLCLMKRMTCHSIKGCKTVLHRYLMIIFQFAHCNNFLK